MHFGGERACSDVPVDRTIFVTQRQIGGSRMGTERPREVRMNERRSTTRFGLIFSGLGGHTNDYITLM